MIFAHQPMKSRPKRGSLLRLGHGLHTRERPPRGQCHKWSLGILGAMTAMISRYTLFSFIFRPKFGPHFIHVHLFIPCLFFFEGPSSPSTTVMTALAVQQLTLSLSNCHVQRFTMEVSPFQALPEALQANSLFSDFDAILNFEATMGMKMAPGILRPATAFFWTWLSKNSRKTPTKTGPRVSTRFSQIQS